MSNRCRSLALFLTHPLFLFFISSQFFLFHFLSLALLHLHHFLYVFSSSPSSLTLSLSLRLPLATHSCPVQGAGERSPERRCTCSFPLLNSVHQSRRCLSTDGGRPLNALHMQPETIYQQTGNVNVGPEPAFMHLQSTPSLWYQEREIHAFSFGSVCLAA